MMNHKQALFNNENDATYGCVSKMNTGNNEIINLPWVGLVEYQNEINICFRDLESVSTQIQALENGLIESMNNYERKIISVTQLRDISKHFKAQITAAKLNCRQLSMQISKLRNDNRKSLLLDEENTIRETILN